MMSLEIVGDRVQDINLHTAKSTSQVIAAAGSQLYSKYGYTIASNLFSKKAMVMTLQQSSKLTRANLAGTATMLVETGLDKIADGIGNPTVRQGCKIIGKSTGIVGQVYQGAAVGGLIGGGPVGMIAGGVIAGAVWLTCEILSQSE